MVGVIDGAFWTCRICTSPSLSSHHEHCPNCSHERDWDASDAGQAGSDPLRFQGEDYSCCDEGWSDAARFCGCCGDRLRKRRRGYFGTGSPAPSQRRVASPESDGEERRTIVPFLALDWLDDEERAASLL